MHFKNCAVVQSIDILSVYFPSKFRTRTPNFSSSPYPYPYPYPQLQMIPSPYLFRSHYFKFSPYSVLIPFPYLGTENGKCTDPSPYSGVCTPHRLFLLGPSPLTLDLLVLGPSKATRTRLLRCGMVLRATSQLYYELRSKIAFLC